MARSASAAIRRAPSACSRSSAPVSRPDERERSAARDGPHVGERDRCRAKKASIRRQESSAATWIVGDRHERARQHARARDGRCRSCTSGRHPRRCGHRAPCRARRASRSSRRPCGAEETVRPPYPPTTGRRARALGRRHVAVEHAGGVDAFARPEQQREAAAHAEPGDAHFPDVGRAARSAMTASSTPTVGPLPARRSRAARTMQPRYQPPAMKSGAAAR